MPTYDYQCGGCGHRFDEFQTMSAPPLRKCPACKKSKLERLIGAGAGVIFKGSGFYQTDYRSSSYQAGKQQAEAPAAPAAPACSAACGTDKAPAGCKMAAKGKKG
jgi:putative FmdB family regulatory protein